MFVCLHPATFSLFTLRERCANSQFSDIWPFRTSCDIVSQQLHIIIPQKKKFLKSADNRNVVILLFNRLATNKKTYNFGDVQPRSMTVKTEWLLVVVGLILMLRFLESKKWNSLRIPGCFFAGDRGRQMNETIRSVLYASKHIVNLFRFITFLCLVVITLYLKLRIYT